MEGLLVLGVVVAALSVFGALAMTLGVDSRVDSDDPRSPARGLTV